MADSESRRLPERPSVDQLRKQAKDLLRAWRDGDASVVERVHVHKPQAAEPVLADAQLVLAREYGFESWPKLVHHVQALHPQRLDHLESIARAFVAARTRVTPKRSPDSMSGFRRGRTSRSCGRWCRSGDAYR